mmetsp:Transcript_3781/g.7005  ORF Transcript_3781/g.7005 Transcript_3781/m.7005 type:complete len:179 (+) Transcript_3781:409-945(+)
MTTVCFIVTSNLKTFSSTWRVSSSLLTSVSHVLSGSRCVRTHMKLLPFGTGPRMFSWVQKNYSTPIDIWSVGCIFAEMANGKPLFPGQADNDQLWRIFQILGSPSPKTWPGIVDLPEYKSNLGNFKPKPWSEVCPRLDKLGLDLLSKMLVYDPAKRITAANAMKHPFFDDLRKIKKFS